LLQYRVKPELRALGPRYGRQLGEIRKLLEQADPAEVARLSESGQRIPLGEFTLEPAEVLVEREGAAGYAVATDGGYTVAVSTEVTPELRAEGMAREVVHLVQNLRKTAGLEISDRIAVAVQADTAVAEALTAHEVYIKGETLSTSLELGGKIADGATETHEIDGESVTISLKKVSDL
jgi:isoleucyl-tRNA synthetase